MVDKEESSNINKILERILESIENLNKTVKTLTYSVKSLENKVSELDTKLNKRCDDLETELSHKVSVNEFTPVERQVKSLQSNQDKLYAQVRMQADELSRVIDLTEQQQLEASKMKLQNEAYSKRLNVLIHGIVEDQENPLGK